MVKNCLGKHAGGLICRAEKTPDLPPKSTDDEARLEAFESSLKAKKGAKPLEGGAARRPPANPNGLAEWKEGELFPEGWDEMSPVKKATELYVGQRGFLFWSTKLSLAGIGVLAGAWVLFRFVGPLVAGYKLANDINSPNF